MKKILKIGFAVLSVVIVLGMSACSGDEDSGNTDTPTIPGDPITPDDPHTHTYSDAWSSDDTHHWHTATCEHTSEVKDKVAHTEDSGTVTKEASESEAGKKEYKCTVCQKVLRTEEIPVIGTTEPEHTHTFADAWTSDDTHHWHAATCEHTTEVSEKDEHTLGEWAVVTSATEDAKGSEKRTCTVCGKEFEREIPMLEHTHKYSDAWTSDDTHHWHATTCGHTTEISGKIEHSWNAGMVTTAATCTTSGEKKYTCSVCGKEKTESIPPTHSFGDPSGNERTCSVCGRMEILATSDNVVNIIKALQGEGPHNVKVTGAITTETIKSIRTELNALTDDQKVNLDLSETTGVTSMGNSAFRDCNNLTSISIPRTAKTIVIYAFSNCKNLTSVEIPDSVTEIGDNAFSFCSSLTTVEIPDSVTEIGNSAFSSCTSLTDISIPSSVKTIRNSAFHNCTGLTSVSILSGVTSIGGEAFSDCRGLTSVEIPDSVKSIGNSAFSSCIALESVTIKGETPPTLGVNAFSGNRSYRKIYVPKGTVDAYKEAWSGYADDIRELSE